MPTFTFQDIFKSSFLERLDAVSLPDAAIALALAFCLGLFIFLVYKKCYAGVMYAPSFGVTLIALTLITTLLILAVTSSIWPGATLLLFRFSRRTRASTKARTCPSTSWSAQWTTRM